MKDKKRKYILMIILLGVLMLLSGCVRKECDEKVKDLEFTCQGYVVRMPGM